jgi:hypothetical protein
MAASIKMRWKRCLNELRFVHEELEFVGDISQKAGGDFQVYYQEYCGREGFNLEELNQRHAHQLQELYKTQTREQDHESPPPDSDSNCALVPHRPPLSKVLNSVPNTEPPPQSCDYEMTQDEIEIHNAFHKVFRKIALQIHPDKIEDAPPYEKSEKRKLFTDAKAALEERKYFILLEIAERIGVSTPRNYRQQIRWMKTQLKDLNAQLAYEQKTYNYLFSECDTNDEKDRLLKQFMTQVFGPQLFEK